ncbi:MAG TPA: hypothetical protein VIP11_15720 [Gemmatimonadaceae bacterium]
MTRRRDFLTHMGAAAASLAIDPSELHAASVAKASGPWDTSWLDRLATAKYRVVFNATVIDDGAVMNYAATFLDHFHEVHDTTVAETRPVVVFRRLGTPMALNDKMWERYPIGADAKVTDASGAPMRRNPFWRAANPSDNAAYKIETMHQRGMISLVCNVSIGSMGQRFAKEANRDVEEVRAELRANLVPGSRPCAHGHASQSAIERMTRAGFPPTRVFGGTFLVTTEPAATTEFSPIVTPPMMVAPAAIQTFLSIAIGFAITPDRRSEGWIG